MALGAEVMGECGATIAPRLVRRREEVGDEEDPKPRRVRGRGGIAGNARCGR
jgi:hypothetical protein